MLSDFTFIYLCKEFVFIPVNFFEYHRKNPRIYYTPLCPVDGSGELFRSQWPSKSGHL